MNVCLITLGLMMGSLAQGFSPFSQVASSSKIPQPYSARSGGFGPGVGTGAPILDDWKVLNTGSIVGTVRNHPMIEDGDVIATSPVTNPSAAKERAIVSTESGSKYRLGTPLFEEIEHDEQLVRHHNNNNDILSQNNDMNSMLDLKTRLRLARQEYSLTGQTVGLDGGVKYLLAGRPQKSTSGKSKIYTGYESDQDGLPVGDALTIKITANFEALERESNNYKAITTGIRHGQYVKLIDYLPVAGKDKLFSTQSALVMEKGDMDLKAHIATYGPLVGEELQDAIRAIATCIRAVHSSKMVWTDLKTENFVVITSDDNVLTVKGIDLESAMPFEDNPVDYSPEACPPEFAKAFLAGDSAFFVLDYSYDIWSLGVTAFELATGRGIFDGKSPLQITQILSSPNFQADLTDVDDPKLMDLIRSCLQVEANRRPTIGKLFSHPYLSTGLKLRLF